MVAVMIIRVLATMVTIMAANMALTTILFSHYSCPTYCYPSRHFFYLPTIIPLTVPHSPTDIPPAIPHLPIFIPYLPLFLPLLLIYLPQFLLL